MNQAQFEVEQKFRVKSLEPVERALRELGAHPGDAVQQVDVYFAHPVRDFSQTDEAFRLRRIGEQNIVTYKGPKIDAQTKTRREIELELPSCEEAADQFRELMEALGFQPVATVVKQRREWQVASGTASTNVALDEVAGVGSFVEVEQMAAASDIEAVQRQLATLADQLGLDLAANERRSYLELLLETGN